MTRSSLAAAVERRAQQRCEYCRMHQSLQNATFHIEHVVPESKGGETDLANLACACPACNLYKSDMTQANDPDTHEIATLLNPRVDQWSDHFRWEGYRVVALTAIGRVTISALHLNSERRLRIREAEDLFGLFPPE